MQKLVVPAAAAVSGNRSISFRPSLTPGGVNRAVDKNNRETVSSILHTKHTVLNSPYDCMRTENLFIFAFTKVKN